MKSVLLTLSFFVLFVAVARAGVAADAVLKQIPSKSLNVVTFCAHRASLLSALAKESKLPKDVVTKFNTACSIRASASAGMELTEDDLLLLAPGGVSRLFATAVTRHAEYEHKSSILGGWFSLVGVIWLLAIAMVTLGVGVAVALCCGPVLLAMPVFIWYGLGYGVCFAAAFILPSHVHEMAAPFVACSGCALGQVLVCFTLGVFRDYRSSKTEGQMLIGFCLFIGFTMWSAAAIRWDSKLLGFFAIATLEAGMGFFLIIMPGCIMMGFEEDWMMPRACFVSLLLWVAAVLNKLLGERIIAVRAFEWGALICGSYVFFLSIITMSFQGYMHKHGRPRGFSDWFMSSFGNYRYILLNIVAGASFLFAAWAGSALNLPSLTGTAGTFGMIYLCSKYAEIPFEIHPGLSGLALLVAGAILYGFSLFLSQNPQYIISFEL